MLSAGELALHDVRLPRAMVILGGAQGARARAAEERREEITARWVHEGFAPLAFRALPVRLEHRPKPPPRDHARWYAALVTAQGVATGAIRHRVWTDGPPEPMELLEELCEFTPMEGDEAFLLSFA